MMRVLLTGASGWLGTSAIAVLRNMDADITAISKYDSIPNAHSTVLLKDAEDVRGQFDGLIHLAFRTKDQEASPGFISDNRSLIALGDRLLRRHRPTWVVTVGSGDEVHPRLAGEISLYGRLKADEARVFEESCKELGITNVRGRLWAASGQDMRHHKNYALGSFILQSLELGEIRVESKHSVYRKYCDSRQFLDVAVRQALLGRSGTFDSGGQLIEIRDLAMKVAALTGDVRVEAPPADIQRAVDDYFPRNDEFILLSARHGMRPLEITDQIRNTIEGIITQAVGIRGGS